MPLFEPRSLYRYKSIEQAIKCACHENVIIRSLNCFGELPKRLTGVGWVGGGGGGRKVEQEAGLSING